MRLRLSLKWLWAWTLFLTGALAWAKWRLRRRSETVVLTFHRVLSPGDIALTCSLPGMIVKESTFERLAGYLRQYCEVADLGTDAVHPGPDGRRVRVAITFDDGWIDNATTALPIARKHGLRFTVFVCPALAGRRFPFWPERIVRLWRLAQDSSQHRERILSILPIAVEGPGPLVEYLKTVEPADREKIISTCAAIVTLGLPPLEENGADATMDWPEIKNLTEAGMNIGSHTSSHQILTQLDLSEAEAELKHSRAALRQRLATDCFLFAYPNGNWSREVRDLVEQAGYRLAFTTKRGVWNRQSDPLSISRINMTELGMVGPGGTFSRPMFEYVTFWRAYRTHRTRE
jgi:peptidoglycan/xylan/chitin deacetylase (PgdA/CDA1 family)